MIRLGGSVCGETKDPWESEGKAWQTYQKNKSSGYER